MKRGMTFSVLGVLAILVVCAQGGLPESHPSARYATTTPGSPVASLSHDMTGYSAGLYGAMDGMTADGMAADGECPTCVSYGDHLWDNYCFEKERGALCCPSHGECGQSDCDGRDGGSCAEDGRCSGCAACRLKRILSGDLLTSIFGPRSTSSCDHRSCDHGHSSVTDATSQLPQAASQLPADSHGPQRVEPGLPVTRPQRTGPPRPVDVPQQKQPKIPRNDLPAKAMQATPKTSRRTVTARLVSQRLSDYIQTD